MATRLQLHEKLCEILGSRNVYFDPPMNTQMKYPAIRYSRKKIDKVYANDSVYRLLIPYEIIMIDHNPDNEYVNKLLKLQYCEHDRHYTANNLHHDVFTLYY